MESDETNMPPFTGFARPRPATTTRTQPTTQATGTLEDIVARMREVLERAQMDDPLRNYMLAHGFDPSDGGRLVLPDRPEWRLAVGASVPAFVSFSKLLRYPVLVSLQDLRMQNMGPEDV